MEHQNFHFLLFSFAILTTCNFGVYALSKQYNDYGITKLFVFGDSYVDTGNLHYMWKKEPYGHSFPGKPHGRFCNGRILTDYLAKFLGMRSPAPYHQRNYLKSRLHYGMNFAYGGAGVFETLLPRPNISAQIDLFENIMNDSLYTKFDLESSLVLLALSGNDYDAYMERGGKAGDMLLDFVPKLIGELALNLLRLSKLGAKRIAVGGIPPMGCLPFITKPNFSKCDWFDNHLKEHNRQLTEMLMLLNNKTLPTTFAYLDLHNTFTNIINNKTDSTGKLKFPDPLRPCCLGMGNSSCGEVNPQGEKLYTVCNNPESAFFWDDVHPAQAGWEAAFTDFKPTFDQICSFS